ncbi:MAG: EAL domain-containing protein [Candidatus Dormibacteria bacterium]
MKSDPHPHAPSGTVGSRERPARVPGPAMLGAAAVLVAVVLSGAATLLPAGLVRLGLDLAAALLVAVLVGFLLVRLEGGRRRLAGADAALRAAEARLRAVIGDVTQAILLVGEDGVVTAANPAAGRLFGAAGGELAGRHVEQLLPSYRLSASAPDQRGATRVSQPDMAAFRRDGTCFVAHVDTSVSTGEGGATRILVVRDAPEGSQPAAAARPVLHDSLTGLPNRDQFTERLLARIQQGAQRSTPFSVFMMDLDRFAEVNRSLGHLAGDQLLRAVGERLRQTLRATDLVARLGSDEFAVILGGSATPATSVRIARQVLGAFREPLLVDGQPMEPSVSIGVANFPEHGTDTGTLMLHAESAMYAAKEARRGWMVYSQADDTAEVEDRVVRLAELRKALDNQELELFYQPVVRVADAALVSVEATVRWRHHRRGLLEPDQFIPAAEQTEIIRPLTRTLLGMAVGQQSRWREQGYALRVGVKIAGRNAQDRQFPKAVGALLRRWSVPPTALAIHIDESTTLSLDVETLNSLAGSGVSLAVDNFGSGPTSLLRLRGLPFTELRLDPAVAASLRGSGSQSASVREIVDLAHTLNLTVTARGVDDEATLAALQQVGCDAGQGRLWSEPVPAGAVIPLLRLLARQSRFPGLGKFRSEAAAPPGGPPSGAESLSG